MFKIIDYFYIVCDCDNWDSIKNVNYYINIVYPKKYLILINKSDKIGNKLYKEKITKYFIENHKDNFVFLNFNNNIREILLKSIKNNYKI